MRHLYPFKVGLHIAKPQDVTGLLATLALWPARRLVSDKKNLLEPEKSDEFGIKSLITDDLYGKKYPEYP